jgi:hypothetical protein
MASTVEPHCIGVRFDILISDVLHTLVSFVMVYGG